MRIIFSENDYGYHHMIFSRLCSHMGTVFVIMEKTGVYGSEFRF